MQFRRVRRLVRGIDSGKIAKLASKRPLVKPLRITPLAFLNRRVDEDLDELAFGNAAACHLPFGAVG